MNTTAKTIITVLLLIIAGGIYKFMFQGATQTASDGRQSITMNEAERDLVLGEMRMFLTSVQEILAAAGKNDMKAVAISARKVGKAAQAEVPGTLMGKLPMGFKQLGFDTHTKFDQLALDADSLADKEHALEQLSVLMQNCVACHEAHRIDLEVK